MRIKESISWLVTRAQQALFPFLDDSLPSPLTEQEKHLVMILELVQIEKHIPGSHWQGRPPAERKAIGRAFVAKSVLRYPHTRILIHELLARPNLCLICGFGGQKDVWWPFSHGQRGT